MSNQFVEAIAEEASRLSDELDADQQALKDCFDKLPADKRELLVRYYSGGEPLVSSPPNWAGRSTQRGRPSCARGSRSRRLRRGNVGESRSRRPVEQAATADRVDKAAGRRPRQAKEQSP